MKKAEPILLLGAGGHCKSCIELLSISDDYDVVGIVDKDESAKKEVLGVKVIGTDSDLALIIQNYSRVLVTVGQIKSPDLRIKIFENAKRLGASFPTLFSPTSFIANTATIAEGTICFHQTIVNATARVGRNCIINNKTLIDHDSIIGSHCHISTGVLVNGGVVVEEGCFVGSGAILHEGVKIGGNSIIGAGQVVKTDITSNTVLK